MATFVEMNGPTPSAAVDDPSAPSAEFDAESLCKRIVAAICHIEKWAADVRRVAEMIVELDQDAKNTVFFRCPMQIFEDLCVDARATRADPDCAKIIRATNAVERIAELISQQCSSRYFGAGSFRVHPMLVHILGILCGTASVAAGASAWQEARASADASYGQFAGELVVPAPPATCPAPAEARAPVQPAEAAASEALMALHADDSQRIKRLLRSKHRSRRHNHRRRRLAWYENGRHEHDARRWPDDARAMRGHGRPASSNSDMSSSDSSSCTTASMDDEEERASSRSQPATRPPPAAKSTSATKSTGTPAPKTTGTRYSTCEACGKRVTKGGPMGNHLRWCKKFAAQKGTVPLSMKSSVPKKSPAPKRSNEARTEPCATARSAASTNAAVIPRDDAGLPVLPLAVTVNAAGRTGRTSAANSRAGRVFVLNNLGEVPERTLRVRGARATASFGYSCSQTLPSIANPGTTTTWTAEIQRDKSNEPVYIITPADSPKDRKKGKTPTLAWRKVIALTMNEAASASVDGNLEMGLKNGTILSLLSEQANRAREGSSVRAGGTAAGRDDRVMSAPQDDVQLDNALDRDPVPSHVAEDVAMEDSSPASAPGASDNRSSTTPAASVSSPTAPTRPVVHARRRNLAAEAMAAALGQRAREAARRLVENHQAREAARILARNGNSDSGSSDWTNSAAGNIKAFPEFPPRHPQASEPSPRAASSSLPRHSLWQPAADKPPDQLSKEDFSFPVQATVQDTRLVAKSALPTFDV